MLFRSVSQSRYIEGEWENGLLNGYGKYESLDRTTIHIGQFKDNKFHGRGTEQRRGGDIAEMFEGIWKNGFLVKVTYEYTRKDLKINLKANEFLRDYVKKIKGNNLEEIKEEKRDQEYRQNKNLNLEIFVTEPNPEGEVFFKINTNTDTASLKINGDEVGWKLS